MDINEADLDLAINTFVNQLVDNGFNDEDIDGIPMQDFEAQIESDLLDIHYAYKQSSAPLSSSKPLRKVKKKQKTSRTKPPNLFPITNKNTGFLIETRKPEYNIPLSLHFQWKYDRKNIERMEITYCKTNCDSLDLLIVHKQLNNPRNKNFERFEFNIKITRSKQFVLDAIVEWLKEVDGKLMKMMGCPNSKTEQCDFFETSDLCKVHFEGSTKQYEEAVDQVINDKYAKESILRIEIKDTEVSLVTGILNRSDNSDQSAVVWLVTEDEMDDLLFRIGLMDQGHVLK